MKIAQIVATYPPQIGGMGRVAHEECWRLARRGHAVTLFTLAYPNSIYDSDANQPFTIVRLKPWFRLGDAGMAPTLLRLTRSFDIIHAHYPFYGGAEWALMAQLLRKQPYVLTYHMDAAPVGWLKKIIQYGYDRIVSPVIIKRARMVITLDDEHRATMAVARFAKQTVTIANGVDTTIFQPRECQADVNKRRLMNNKKIILFVGNLLPFKRLDLVLRALQQISDPMVNLLIIGDGYEREAYQRMTRELGIETRVIFNGYCHDQVELSCYYSVAMCLVVASDKAESFSLVALEALASECPVVAADIPGVRGRVDDGRDGFLVQPGSLADLVKGIERCLALSKEERKKMGERGRKKVIECYSWERHVDSLESVYRQSYY